MLEIELQGYDVLKRDKLISGCRLGFQLGIVGDQSSRIEKKNINQP